MPSPDDANVCAGCGATLRPGMLRCRECGTALGGVAVVNPPRDASPRPDSPATPKPARASDPQMATAAVAETAAESAKPARRFRLPHIALRWNRRISIALAGLVVIAALAVGGWLLSQRTVLPAEVVGELRAPGERLTCVVISPDGKHVVAGCASGNVVVWELPAGLPRTLPRLTNEPILALAMLPDGFVMGGGNDTKLLMWDKATSSGTKERSEPGLPHAIVCLAIHPKKAEFVLGLTDGSLVFLGNRKPTRYANAHPNGVRCVAYTPDAETLLTAGVEGGITWRNAETADPTGPTATFTADVGAMAISSDGALTAAGDWNGQLEWFETSAGKSVAKLEQPEAVSGVAITGTHVVTSGWDGHLRCWSRASKELVYDGKAPAPLAGLSVSRDGKQAATVSNSDRLLLWKLP